LMRYIRSAHTSLLALVVLAVIGSSVAGQALGAGATIRIESAQLSPGESATVVLQGLDFPAPGLGAATIDVHYDPTAVSVTACEVDPEGVFELSVCNEDFADDTVRVTALHTQGVTGDFALAEISVQAVGEAGQQTLDVAVDTLAGPAGASFDAAVEDGALSIDGVSESGELPVPLSDSADPDASTSEGVREAGSTDPDASTSEGVREVGSTDPDASTSEGVREAGSTDADASTSEGVREAGSTDPDALSATGGSPLLATDQPWLYLIGAALSLGVAALAVALIRRRRRA
jgi:hypothetical protein